MDKTLRSIYLRLDVNMQHLTSKAIAQIIVKLIYANNGGMRKNEIKDALAKVNEWRHIDSKEVDNILDNLVPKEVKLHNGLYTLSTPKRDNIRKSIEDSEKRKEIIIDTFFGRLNSSRDDIREWLTDVSIKFFEVFSDEWISDLSAHTNHVTRNESAIRQLITNRTNNNKYIDAEDKKVLPGRFFEFVNTRNSLVIDYLWEYGTSAFASILITNKHGVDKLTLDTFRDSVCILDTNILLFIALESRFKEAMAALEKVFQDLNVKVKILYITKKEYEGKVRCQRIATLHNLEKYGYDVTAMPNDDFTNYARHLKCRSVSDFENFFDYKLALPKHIKEEVAIDLLDNDKELAKEIEKAQNDETLLNKLKDIFLSIVRRKKGVSATCHDIGLLEGVRFLRKRGEPKEEKYFILSEEISVIQYSKSCGFRMGLPLSLRVDTLINMLAVNNGGDTFDASDYKSLFANLIRMELIPHRDTFRQTELYNLYKMNFRIANLPPERVKEIAMEMHHKYLDGEDEKELLRDLNDMVTKGEIKVGDELEETKGLLYESDKQKQRLEESEKKAILALENNIREQVSKEYDEETAKMKKKYKRDAPLLYAFIAFVLIGAIMSGAIGTSVIASLLVSIVAGIVTGVFFNHRADKVVIKKRMSDREFFIRHETEFRLQKQLK
jgi:hypothetical protein